MILLVHILTASLGLLSGYIALSVAKGAPLHRKIGMLFVCVLWRIRARRAVRGVAGVGPTQATALAMRASL